MCAWYHGRFGFIPFFSTPREKLEGPNAPHREHYYRRSLFRHEARSPWCRSLKQTVCATPSDHPGIRTGRTQKPPAGSSLPKSSPTRVVEATPKFYYVGSGAIRCLSELGFNVTWETRRHDVPSSSLLSSTDGRRHGRKLTRSPLLSSATTTTGAVVSSVVVVGV